jgi:N-acetylneuraminic acid mutarotase
VDGRVYVIGGQGPSSAAPDDWKYSTEVAIFDPTDGWSSGSPLPKAVGGAASCALGGHIYVFGGETNNRTSIYDVAGDAWSSGSASPIARNGHTCVQVAGELIVLGGRNDSGTVGAVEKYDPTSDTWQSLDPMPTPSYWFGADALGAELYVFGGEQLPGPGLLNRVQVFDAAKLP